MEKTSRWSGKALVVEDEPVVARVCGKAVAGLGFDVDIARNGTEACQMVGKTSYRICVSDVRTPELDGIDFYRFLKTNAPELAANTVFTTGDVLNTRTQSFFAIENRPLVPKPFSSNELVVVIETLLEKNSRPA